MSFTGPIAMSARAARLSRILVDEVVAEVGPVPHLDLETDISDHECCDSCGVPESYTCSYIRKPMIA